MNMYYVNIDRFVNKYHIVYISIILYIYIHA
jgi:hypothetical protein